MKRNSAPWLTPRRNSLKSFGLVFLGASPAPAFRWIIEHAPVRRTDRKAIFLCFFTSLSIFEASVTTSLILHKRDQAVAAITHDPSLLSLNAMLDHPLRRFSSHAYYGIAIPTLAFARMLEVKAFGTEDHAVRLCDGTRFDCDVPMAA